MDTINPYKLIPAMKPELRLQMLHAYMCWRVDQWPKKVVCFDKWLVQRYDHLIPGTVAHAKKIATHCFYCNTPFSDEKIRVATDDHHFPQSEGYTDRRVICCFDCNNRKANILPEVLQSKINSAIAYNREFWGYSGKRLKFIAAQLERIFRDRINGTGPTIYYFKR